jgi:uncharacterized protein (TIGR02996 family)
MRTFQYSDATSHKFWNIEVTGKSFTVTFGKIGTAGQTQTKTFPTTDKAQAEADKLIKEKTKKGYVETTPKVAGATTEVEALEKALVANPHDGTAWRAYADYLAEHDDPRGEFMQVQLALEDESLATPARKKLQAREKALLKKHEREWLGPLVECTLDGEPVAYWTKRKQSTRAPVGHSFARGWLNRLEFHNLKVNEARALAKSPGARLLRELVVEEVESEAPVGSKEQYIDSFYEPGPDVPKDIDPYDDPGLHALTRYPNFASIRLFQLGEGDPEDVGMDSDAAHLSGELAYHLVKQMPNIEELYLLAHQVDGDKLFVLPMPNLRVFQLYHSNNYPLEKLAANKTLTNLTAILCHPHAIDYDDADDGAYIRLAQLRAICRSPHLKGLTHLRLRLTDFGDKGAKEIVDSGILKRLKMLDLLGGSMTDKGAKLLADCPDLKHLEFLHLSNNALTAEGTKAIKATGVKCDLSEQHGDDDESEFGDDEIPGYLFDGDIE